MDDLVYLNHNSWFLYRKNFIDWFDDDMYNELWSYKPAEKHEIHVFGKTCKLPRYQQSYGAINYVYSGIVADVKPMTPLLLKIKDEIDKMWPEFIFNSCLINWYTSGQDYISFHSDDEKTIVAGSPVIGLTFCKGDPRTLRIKEKKTKKTIYDLKLENRSLYMMGGQGFQTYYLHGIPKTTKNGERVSLTFRQFSRKTTSSFFEVASHE